MPDSHSLLTYPSAPPAYSTPEIPDEPSKRNEAYNRELHLLYQNKTNAEHVLQTANPSDEKQSTKSGMHSQAKIYYANRLVDAIHFQIHSIENKRRIIDSSFCLSKKEPKDTDHWINEIDSLTTVLITSNKYLTRPKDCSAPTDANCPDSDSKDTTIALFKAAQLFSNITFSVVEMLNDEQANYLNFLSSANKNESKELCQKTIDNILESRYQRQLMLIDLQIQESNKLLSSQNNLDNLDTSKSEVNEILSNYNQWLLEYYQDIERQHDEIKNNSDIFARSTELHDLNMKMYDCNLMLNDLGNIEKNRKKFLTSNSNGYSECIALGLANALLLAVSVCVICAATFAIGYLGVAMCSTAAGGGLLNGISFVLQTAFATGSGYIGFKGVEYADYAKTQVSSNANNFWGEREHNKLVTHLYESAPSLTRR